MGKRKNNTFRTIHLLNGKSNKKKQEIHFNAICKDILSNKGQGGKGDVSKVH